MDKNNEYYNKCLENLKKITSEPESYLEVTGGLCEEIKQQLKKTYDFAKNEEINTVKSSALPELIVRNFDLEQIWQQIELQNDALLTKALTNVSKLVVGKDKLIFKNLEKAIADSEEEKMGESKNEEKNKENETSDEISLNDVDSSEEEVQHKETERKTSRKSEVDDDFFHLDEMEHFLVSEEKKLNDPDSGNDSEESESENESVDIFNADESENDEDKFETAKYKDFFVANDDYKKPKRNKFLEGFEDDTHKSGFEQRQERLSRKIEEIEKSAIGEKPWQLKGEITAENRPQNSLLEEIVEFDMSTRPAPIMTEQSTLQLEDIIKQRIRDKVFDSVERKEKPVESLLEYKKALVLNQEKSKESLAQIYEKEYLEQKAALETEDATEKEEEEPETHKEVTSLMTSLFNKLDALSNFHFSPKPAVPELKIVSNLPAVNMEEVAPVATSDATLLAPEEIKAKPKAEVLGKAERTKTDMNRERRKKKIKQKVHAQLKEKKQAKLMEKTGKRRNKNHLENVVKARNVEKMDETVGRKSIQSSSAFFAQLEEEVKSHIKGKVKGKRKKEKIAVDAKKFKL